jgi:hypothetical protein
VWRLQRSSCMACATLMAVAGLCKQVVQLSEGWPAPVAVLLRVHELRSRLVISLRVLSCKCAGEALDGPAYLASCQPSHVLTCNRRQGLRLDLARIVHSTLQTHTA